MKLKNVMFGFVFIFMLVLTIYTATANEIILNNNYDNKVIHITTPIIEFNPNNSYIVDEIELLRQALVEQKIINNNLQQELCNMGSKATWCIIK
jgi:hypothetical protein